MTVPPGSIEVGKCYLTNSGQVRRATRILPSGWIRYEWRPAGEPSAAWQAASQVAPSFTFQIKREVPCDWTPERDEG